MRRLAHVLLVGVAACTACTTGPPPPTSSPTTLRVSLLESGFDPCALLDSATVEAVMGVGVDDASEHLSGAPVEDIRDCVFFTGDRVLAILSVRQVPTSAAAGEALIAELTEGYPADAAVEPGHLASGVPSTAFGYCDAPVYCFSSLAVSIEPYFVIVTIPRRSGGIRQAEALAGAVIQRLKAN